MFTRRRDARWCPTSFRSITGVPEGLLHAENLGGDIELMLNRRALIGAFPWRYEGLEGCPCRIVAFLDCGEEVEAVGDVRKARRASIINLKLFSHRLFSPKILSCMFLFCSKRY